ncbi:carbohydrate ABC transporter permease [Cytobacillus firmus]|uniref:carbohydrate ABC transporter permease n=1 Tax=Cytobacillus firmus TaxID=1399 RepID=UPI001C8D1FD0|nr:carbohydrate ABC transporter permease [Cytobacillus firmus]MBX9973782.1 carbohydrate ABC transporter permease [Cytobacillus firmus]
MKRSIRSQVTIYILAAFVFVYSFFPIYWITISPLRGVKGFFEDSASLLPTSFDLTFFINIWNETNFPLYYKNSFIVAVATTVVTVIFSSLIAYVLTRFQFRGKNLLLNGMLIGYMLPPMLLAIPLLGMFISFGIEDSLFGLTISHIAMTLPFGVWMLNSFFKTIPFELEESAWMDGASRFQALYRVILPLLIPGVISVGVFSFIVSFTDYTFGLMMVSSEVNKTIPIGLAGIKESTSLQRGELLAGAAMIIVPMVILFSFVTKYFIKGLTAGAVKG